MVLELTFQPQVRDTHSMLKNIFFILLCVVLVVIAFGAFQFLGSYAFVIMLIIVIALFFTKIGKPKFNKK